MTGRKDHTHLYKENRRLKSRHRTFSEYLSWLMRYDRAKRPHARLQRKSQTEITPSYILGRGNIDNHTTLSLRLKILDCRSQHKTKHAYTSICVKYIYAHIHTCVTHTYIPTYLHTCIRTYLHTYTIPTYLGTYMHTCIHPCMRT